MRELDTRKEGGAFGIKKGSGGGECQGRCQITGKHTWDFGTYYVSLFDTRLFVHAGHFPPSLRHVTLNRTCSIADPCPGYLLHAL